MQAKADSIAKQQQANTTHRMQVMHQNATSSEKLALTSFSLYNLQGNARIYMLRKLLQSKATPSNTNNGFLQQQPDAIKVCCIVRMPLIWF